MRANDVRPAEILRHGAYVCLRVPDGARRAAAAAAVPALAERLGLRNEFAAGDGPPADAIAFLRRIGATSADIADDGLLHADAVVHVASTAAAPVAEFCAEVARLVGPAVKPLVLGGVVRPMIYTGNAMYNFAYAHRVLQQPGTVAPNAFLVPMSKTAAWWEKNWMERHTYFLPRYDEGGRMVSEGHALASAAIPKSSISSRRVASEPAITILAQVSALRSVLAASRNSRSALSLRGRLPMSRGL